MLILYTFRLFMLCFFAGSAFCSSSVLWPPCLLFPFVCFLMTVKALRAHYPYLSLRNWLILDISHILVAVVVDARFYGRVISRRFPHALFNLAVCFVRNSYLNLSQGLSWPTMCLICFAAHYQATCPTTFNPSSPPHFLIYLPSCWSAGNSDEDAAHTCICLRPCRRVWRHSAERAHRAARPTCRQREKNKVVGNKRDSNTLVMQCIN